jgi:hypothetical protein
MSKAQFRKTNGFIHRLIAKNRNRRHWQLAAGNRALKVNRDDHLSGEEFSNVLFNIYGYKSNDFITVHPY